MVITYLSAKGSEEKEVINENLELRGGGDSKKNSAEEKPLRCLYATHPKTGVF